MRLLENVFRRLARSLRRITAPRTRPPKIAHRRPARFESLESRLALDGSVPSFLHIGDQSVLGGALWLGLDGSDADGGELTYSVSVSNPNLLHASFSPATNKSLRMNVAGYGQMTFQLFDDLAPRSTQHIEALVNQGDFNTIADSLVKWYRVAHFNPSGDFVIQAGPQDSTSSLGRFDDEYNSDLQFTSSGLLAMAKSIDDTNDNQIFVSGGPLRFLDFQHSIFGVLTDGEAVRQAIQHARVSGDGAPPADIIISSSQIFTDSENAALKLAAAEGASGQSDVTLTISDLQGHQYSQTFHVTVTPDTANSAPFLTSVAFQPHGVKNQPVTLQLSAYDIENNPSFFDASKPASETVNYTINANHTTGVVTLTPPPDFVGTFTVLVGVRGLTNTTTSDQFDSQLVTIVIDEPSEPKVDLALSLTKPDGSPISSLAPGDEFILHVSAEDVRTDPHGTFAAYMDITWDSTKAVVAGPIRYGSKYGSGKRGTTQTPGLIDEVGAFTGIAELGAGANEVFSVPMRATAAGTLIFTADPADTTPGHDILVFGTSSTAVPDEVIQYGTVSINVSGMGAVPDAFDIAANGGANTLDVLANDVIDPTVGGTLTITSVGPTDYGGIVSITDGGKKLHYTPPANYFGPDKFTYSLSDGRGGTDATVVALNVATPGNHAPIAENDFDIAFPNTGRVLSVLQNDSTAPDTGETLQIISVSAPDRGGSAAESGGNILYRPAPGFEGIDRFTYTISDGRGGTATAKVSVQVLSPSGIDPHADIILVLLASDGELLTSLAPNQEFALMIMAQDTSAHPRGVFAAYLDVLWDATRAVATSPIQYFTDYRSGLSGSTANPGLIDEAGAFSDSSELGHGPRELFYVTMRALSAGPLTFTADPADILPEHQILVYGVNEALPQSAIHYGSASIVVSGLTAHDDSFTVSPDDGQIPLNVLTNDSPGAADSSLLSVTSVGPGDRGGSLTIAQGGQGLIYVPAHNFSGTERFTYGVTDGLGAASSAMITFNVLSVAESTPADSTPGITLENGVLQITGSPNPDSLTVDVSRRKLQIRGLLDQTIINQSFPLSRVQQITADLGSGNDFFSIRGSVRIPLSVDAGDGSDTVFAGGSSTILVGGDGNDMLFGSSRRDLIIGGAGQDQLFGHGSSDLLIGGATAFDQNQPALRAIRSAWSARTSLANRIANLTTGADSSLAPLGVSLKLGETVLNDAGVDTLLGSPNTDWLFSSDPQDNHTQNRRGHSQQSRGWNAFKNS